jgi:hypothetical protein
MQRCRALCSGEAVNLLAKPNKKIQQFQCKLSGHRQDIGEYQTLVLVRSLLARANRQYVHLDDSRRVHRARTKI